MCVQQETCALCKHWTLAPKPITEWMQAHGVEFPGVCALEDSFVSGDDATCGRFQWFVKES